MRKNFKKMTLVSLFLLLLAPELVEADKIAIDPIFTYGGSLDSQQLEITRQSLGVDAEVKEIPVEANELNGLLHDTYPYRQVYSSIYITPADNNGEVTVEIITPYTITDITPIQYQNAAITAGAVDVNIKVASAVKVDGSGALAGVYKAFESQGKALDGQAVRVAQDELALTSKFTEEHDGDSAYSDELMNAALADIKQEIQKSKENNGGSINQEGVQTIINQVINNYNLSAVLTDNNRSQLEGLMNQFAQLNLSQDQRNQLLKFGQKLQDQGGDLLSKAKTSWDGLDENTKEGITGFLENLWQALVDFFSSLFA